MTHEFKDVAGDTYLSIDASQPVIIDNGISGSSLQPAQWKLTATSQPIEPNVQFNMGDTEPVLVISAGGKVTWNGREVVGDEEFKQAMMDLNVKLSGINKTIQPALTNPDIVSLIQEAGFKTWDSQFFALCKSVAAHCRGGANK